MGGLPPFPSVCLGFSCSLRADIPIPPEYRSAPERPNELTDVLKYIGRVGIVRGGSDSSLSTGAEALPGPVAGNMRVAFCAGSAREG